MVSRVVISIILNLLLAGCHIENSSQHTTKRVAPSQVQKQELTAQQSITVKGAATQHAATSEPKESEKERALRELISADNNHWQAQFINTKDPEDLSTLYKTKITENWNPPENIIPKTRATLAVQMTRDGTILSIAVTQTSGERHFDEAAILAIRRIGKFDEVKDLSEQDYYRFFKNHKIEFTPHMQGDD